MQEDWLVITEQYYCKNGKSFSLLFDFCPASQLTLNDCEYMKVTYLNCGY